MSHPAFVMFFALLALYAPVSSLAAYLPVVRSVPRSDHVKLALGLFLYVAIFSLFTLWIGEFLLELLGISTAALTTTGGIALSFAGVRLMLGLQNTPAQAREREKRTEAALRRPRPLGWSRRAGGTAVAPPAEAAPASATWQSVLLFPTTFPLTVGGATFALLVSFAAQAGGISGRGILSIPALAYAALTAVTLFSAGLLSTWASARALDLLDRVAGILLTAIAVTLLVRGGTGLIENVLHTVH
ncbi:MAG: MarC family protein [Candidatus Dormibacteraeota bacterium]|nr:MarC family protein [Candidatus Dormibacteraeota bacterium]